MAALEKQIYKTVEWHFYHYFDIKRDVVDIADYRSNVLYGSSGNVEPGGRGVSRHSDPTALKAIKLAMGRDTTEKEKWITVIERTMQRYKGTGKDKLVELKYFSELGPDHICTRLNVDRSTYFNWTKEIVYYAALLAAQYGLIKIDRAS